MTDNGCQKCGENTFSGDGASACTSCPKGKVSAPGSRSIDDCIHGKDVKFIPSNAKTKKSCQICTRENS